MKKVKLHYIVFSFLMLFTISMITYCGNGGGKADVKNIPAWANLIVNIDAKALLDKEPELAKTILNNGEAKEFIDIAKKNNIDITKDITNIRFFLDKIEEDAFKKIGKGNTEELKGLKFGVIINGNFSSQDVMKVAEAFLARNDKGQEITKDKIGDTNIIYDNKTTIGFAMLDKTIIMGKKDDIKEILELMKGNGKNISENKVLNKELGEVGGRHIWGALTITDEMKKKMGGEMSIPLFKPDEINAISFGANIGSKIDATAGLVFNSEDMAQEMKEGLEGLVALFEEGTKSIDADFDFGQDGKRTVINVSIAKEEVMKNLGNLPF